MGCSSSKASSKVDSDSPSSAQPKDNAKKAAKPGQHGKAKPVEKKPIQTFQFSCATINNVEQELQIDPRRILHLKGFALGLTPNNSVTHNQEILNILKSKLIIAFDGDNLALNSYTMQIPSLLSAMATFHDKNNLMLWAFKYGSESEIEQFVSTWDKHKIELPADHDVNALNEPIDLSKTTLTPIDNYDPDVFTCVICIIPIKQGTIKPGKDGYFEYLGAQGLETSKATDILLMGGGKTVEEEFKIRKEKEVSAAASGTPLPETHWHVYPTSRPVAGTKKGITCPLLSYPDDTPGLHKLSLH